MRADAGAGSTASLAKPGPYMRRGLRRPARRSESARALVSACVLGSGHRSAPSLASASLSFDRVGPADRARATGRDSPLSPGVLRRTRGLAGLELARRHRAEDAPGPVGLPGDPGRDAPRRDRRNRDLSWWQRALPRHRVRRARSWTDHQRRSQAARRTAKPSPDRVSGRLIDRRGGAQGGEIADWRSRAGHGSARFRSHPRTRPRRASRLRAAGQRRLLPRRRGHEHQRPPGLPVLGPGPMEALDAYLAEGAPFAIESGREKFLLSFNPHGFLRRT
jgi:hypothetical protein